MESLYADRHSKALQQCLFAQMQPQSEAVICCKSVVLHEGNMSMPGRSGMAVERQNLFASVWHCNTQTKWVHVSLYQYLQNIVDIMHRQGTLLSAAKTPFKQPNEL